VGDVLLKASFVLIDERVILPEVTPYLKIKFPTADSDRGLGTGEFDETLGVDLSKRLVGDLYGYVTLAYTFIGDPPGTDFRNTFGWSVGAAYSIAPPLALFAFVDGSTAISPDQSDPVELRVGAEYRFSKALKFTGAVSRGLTDGAADWTLAAGATVRF
jgi:predicted porin